MALLHYNSSDSWIRFIFYLKQYNLATNQYKKDDIKSRLFSVVGSIDRVTPFRPALAFTGLDFFGPLYVRMVARGKSIEKRWICLFTCLNSRAVHLEVAYSLSLEDFLLCFSKFVSLRGKPTVIYSDNGTNLRAGEAELKLAIDEWMEFEPHITAYATCKNIEWHFSPPHGSHFGGVRERLVQSCKKAMKIVLGTRRVVDKVLAAVVAEVSALLNARPLTHLSVDHRDPDPLTPNHFLHA